MLRLLTWAVAAGSPGTALARVTVADRNAGAVVTTTPSGLQYYDYVSLLPPPDAQTEGSSENATPSPPSASQEKQTASRARSAVVETGDVVTVQYTLGTTGARNGWRIESSYEPLSFRVGDAAVVQGLEEGVTGMRAGMRRRLIIPPQLGYTGRGRDRPVPTGFGPYQRFKNLYLNPNIPYKPDVVMDVTLLRIN